MRASRFLVAVAVAFVAACSGAHAMPKGPAPEYEEPAAPSWLDAGSPAAPDAAPCDGGEGC